MKEGEGERERKREREGGRGFQLDSNCDDVTILRRRLIPRNSDRGQRSTHIHTEMAFSTFNQPPQNQPNETPLDINQCRPIEAFKSDGTKKRIKKCENGAKLYILKKYKKFVANEAIGVPMRPATGNAAFNLYQGTTPSTPSSSSSSLLPPPSAQRSRKKNRINIIAIIKFQKEKKRGGGKSRHLLLCFYEHGQRLLAAKVQDSARKKAANNKK